RIYLPQDSEKIKFGKDKSKTRVEMWLEHHKNIKIRKNRDGVEEMVYSGQDHLALTSAYCDIAFEYILKNTSTTKRTQRKVKVHRVGRG
ncbi:MAG: hypothetical protein WC479_09445, partial [Candidatus Izemoplasmatales bacterium]